MILDLTPEQRSYKESVERFARETVAPRAAAIDESGEFPVDGLRAAAAQGRAPERVLVVPAVPAAVATAVAALLDAVDVVYVGGTVAAGDARRLVARARERESVLIPLGSRWPLGADVRLTVTEPEWCWDGRLVARRVQVTASGRGVYARERRAALWLPDESGAVAPA
jgi:hypothetical protein